MKINHRRKTPKRRSPVAPPSFRHTDKKKAREKRACREFTLETYLPLYGADLD